MHHPTHLIRIGEQHLDELRHEADQRRIVRRSRLQHGHAPERT